MKRWISLLVCLVFFLPACPIISAQDTGTVTINDVSISHMSCKGGANAYHTGENEITAELLYNGDSYISALVACMVESKTDNRMLAIDIEPVKIADPWPIRVHLTVDIPEETTIANTRAKLMLLDAATLRPLDRAVTISADDSYPYADTSAKTQLVSKISGIISKAENGIISLLPTASSQEEIAIPAAQDLISKAQAYIGMPCSLLLDAASDGSKQAAFLASDTVTIWQGNVSRMGQESVKYIDKDTDEGMSISLSPDLRVWYNGKEIFEPNLEEWFFNGITTDTYFEFSSTLGQTSGDGSPVYDILNICRKQHAVITAIDGEMISTNLFGTFSASGAILQYPDGTLVSPAELAPDDVLVIDRCPGNKQQIVHAIVLKQSFVEGTVCEIDMQKWKPTVRIERADNPTAQETYPFVQGGLSSYNMADIFLFSQGTFYIGLHNEIFAKKYDSIQTTYILSVKDATPFTLYTTNGQFAIQPDDSVLVFDKDNNNIPCHLDTQLYREDFAGTSFYPLFGTQESTSFSELLASMKYLSDQAAPAELITRACRIEKDNFGKLLSIAPVQEELTSISPAQYNKIENNFYPEAVHPAQAYQMAEHADFITVTAEDGKLVLTNTPQTLVPKITYPTVMLGDMQEDGSYGAAFLWQPDQLIGWREAKPAVVSGMQLNSDKDQNPCIMLELLECSLAGYNESYTKTITIKSVNADTGAKGNFDELKIGTVLLYIGQSDVIEEYRIIGSLDPEGKEPFVLSPAYQAEQNGIPGTACLYGFATANTYSSLSIRAELKDYTFPIPETLQTVQIDYQAADEDIVKPGTIDRIIPLYTAGQYKLASCVLAYTVDGKLQSLISFFPICDFTQTWEDKSLNIITKAKLLQDTDENPMCLVSYVSDGETSEKTVAFRGNTQDADTGEPVNFDLLRLGTVFLLQQDGQGNAISCRIAGTYHTDGNTPFTLTEPFAAVDNGIPGDQYQLAFLQKALPGNKFEFYCPATEKEATYQVGFAVNEYFLNNANQNNVRIEVGAFESGDVYEVEEGECSYVLLHTRNGALIDIFSFHTRYPLPE